MWYPVFITISCKITLGKNYIRVHGGTVIRVAVAYVNYYAITGNGVYHRISLARSAKASAGFACPGEHRPEPLIAVRPEPVAVNNQFLKASFFKHGQNILFESVAVLFLDPLEYK